jgi:hypothetical protein
MNSRQATAQDGGPKVTIESPIPLPVTGSLGLTGTANVNITNPADRPVLVRDAENPARHRFQADKECSLSSGVVQCEMSFTFPAASYW